MWLWFVGSVLSLSLLFGFGLFFALGKAEYQRGLVAGEFQANLTHGWHQPVPGDPNPPVLPSPRRSPNEQFVWRLVEAERTPRPGFYHQN